VLDDPVSSLDHVFTRKTAFRLAREGLKRQIIIFTHNIAFLMELEDAVDILNNTGKPVCVSMHTLRRSGNLAGVTHEGLPWHAENVKERVQDLKIMVQNIKQYYPNDIYKYNSEAAIIYDLLREAWESCVEDDLFYSVVCRYRNSVQTLKLTEVYIEDSDISEIDINMSNASTWLLGHDKSKALDCNRPTPDELCADIDTLQKFSEKLRKRRTITKHRRTNNLKL
jgi:ABC-type multidrug transport system ATPase subunit